MRDITMLILDEHEAFRRIFVGLWDLRPHGESTALSLAWQDLADRLEVHASAEEAILYPELLKHGSDQAPGETLDAVGDHNDIRDAIKAAAAAPVASDEWWDAVLECRRANDEHLAEEERDVIPDFREHSVPEARDRLGEQWLAFKAQHPGAEGISGDDVDPDAYVEENS